MWIVYMLFKNIELHKKYITSVTLKRGAIRKKEKLLIPVFINQRRKSLFCSK